MEIFLAVLTALLLVLILMVVFLVSALAGNHQGQQVFDRIRRRVRQGPVWMRNALRRSGDTLVPDWRTRVGDLRSAWRFSARLDSVRAMHQPTIVMVGGVYIDISLKPVDVEHLQSVEFANLKEIRMTCGGSAIWVGRFLHKSCGLRSDLVSSIGASDLASRQLRSALRAERWTRRVRLMTNEHHQCGQSVHLVQGSGRFHTTFTHPGALRNLHWRPIYPQVKRMTDRGGILYISGYFRTGLYLEFEETLKHLSPKIVVCVDHGRFRENDARTAAAELARVFAGNLVDVYICSFQELCQLAGMQGTLPPANGAGPFDPDAVDREEQVLEAVRVMATMQWLPKVTVVRSDVDERQLSAYVVVDGQIIDEHVDRSTRLTNEPGPRNAFNAGLIQSLARGERGADLHETLRRAAKEALAAWLEAAGNRAAPVTTTPR